MGQLLVRIHLDIVDELLIHCDCHGNDPAMTN
jgi:hypothetical protein